MVSDGEVATGGVDHKHDIDDYDDETKGDEIDLDRLLVKMTIFCYSFIINRLQNNK